MYKNNTILFIIIFCLTLIQYSCLSDGSSYNSNIIFKDTFDHGSGNWFWLQKDGAFASSKVKDGQLKLTISDEGENYYSLDIVHEKLKIQYNYQYKISFDAKTNNPVRILTFIQQGRSPWMPYSGRHYFTITQTLQKFEYSFTMR
jgi:hypothetical protein